MRSKNCSPPCPNCRSTVSDLEYLLTRSYRLGLGAPLPKDVKDGDFKRQELSSNDRLRKQLLGKDFAKLYGATVGAWKGRLGGANLGSKPRPMTTSKVDVEEEDDEEGRSTLGKSKAKKKIPIQQGPENLEDDSKEVNDHMEASNADPSRPSKRVSSYLDEVLAEKHRKKQKKKKKHANAVSIQE